MSSLEEKIFKDQNDSKNVLEVMKTKLDESESKNKDDPELRTRKNIYFSLAKSFEKCVTEFQIVQNNVKENIQSSLVRQAEVALNRDLNQKEQLEVIENPQVIEKLYQDKLAGKAHNELKYAFLDLQERHKDIKKLEENVNKVHQLFLDLAALVSLQGNIVDNIEKNISQAKAYVEKGEKNIIKAKENICALRKVII